MSNREKKVIQKQAEQRKGKVSNKIALSALTIVVAVIICITSVAIKALLFLNAHFSRYEYKTQQPITVALRSFLVRLEKPQVPEVVYVDSAKLELDKDIEAFGEQKDIARYICEKWGVVECKTALAVASAESGMREDAWNYNPPYTDDQGNYHPATLDLGIMQVNSIHWGKPGCSMEELTNGYKNIDCAYEIWKASKWSAWSAYNNNAYLAHLGE